MMTKLAITIGMLALLLPASLSAQDDKPLLAVLNFGARGAQDTVQRAMLQTLVAYRWLSEDDMQSFYERAFTEGARLDVLRAEANWRFEDVKPLFERAMDMQPDVLFTRGLPPTLRALTETIDTDDPPAIIFTLSNPIESGVAQSACLHAPHITGVEAQSPYAEILPLLMLQNPDLRYIGTIFGSNEAPGVLGARDIVRIGESLGLQVESVGAFAFSDLRDAANRLVDKGVEAIVLPLDNLVVNGTPVVVEIAREAGIPLLHSTTNAIGMGATFSGGYGAYQTTGEDLGILLHGALSGDLDIAKTAIATVSDHAVGVNLDAAEYLEMQVDPALLEQASALWQDDSYTYSGDMLFEAGQTPPRSLEERLEADQAWLADLHCTPEMIAEQQAALGAQD